MAKVSYTNLKLKVNTEKNTFMFKDQEIEVLQYLPARDKYDLITITLQQAERDGIYNEFLLDMHFSLNLVYMYTNLSFTDKQKEDEFKLYDMLKSNGFFDMFFKSIDETEYDELITNLEAIKHEFLTYNTTAASVIKKFITDMPKNAEATAKIVDAIDPDKMKLVYNMAQATGMSNN